MKHDVVKDFRKKKEQTAWLVGLIFVILLGVALLTTGCKQYPVERIMTNDYRVNDYITVTKDSHGIYFATHGNCYIAPDDFDRVTNELLGALRKVDELPAIGE